MRSTLFRLGVVIAAVAGAACGSTGEPQDAMVVDCGMDATGDATPDGSPWQCEPVPPFLPPKSSTAIEVIFDVPLPILSGTTDSGAVETFYDGEKVIVATTQQLHFVSYSGNVERTLRLTYPGATSIAIREIVRGDVGFGALVDTLGDELRTRFCWIDPMEGLDPAHCTVLLDAQTTLAGARVVRESGGYAVFSQRHLSGDEIAIYRWRFGAIGGLLDAGELWRDPETSKFVLGAAAGPASVTVVTTNMMCETFAHFLDGDMRTVTSVRPPTLTFAGGASRLRDVSGDADDVLLEVRHMNCVGGSPCSAASEWPMTVLFRHDLRSGDLDATPVAIPFTAKSAVLPDGDETAFVYFGPGLHDIRFSRVARNGEALVSEVKLPLSYEQTGIEVQFVGAGRTIGPGDYVFVYAGTGAFRDRRVARIVVP